MPQLKADISLNVLVSLEGKRKNIRGDVLVDFGSDGFQSIYNENGFLIKKNKNGARGNWLALEE